MQMGPVSQDCKPDTSPTATAGPPTSEMTHQLLAHQLVKEIAFSVTLAFRQHKIRHIVLDDDPFNLAMRLLSP
jgi:hypothetical protein